jgi:hypothetical protein
MDNPVLQMALACAERGWPVFPIEPGLKTPATRHGYLDASTKESQIRRWFFLSPDRNLAVATGFPGPDVLDVDTRGPLRSGYGALNRLRAAGLLDGAAAQVRTPSGGAHLYFAGTWQRTGHLPAHHIDFLAQGGYVLLPPSQIDGTLYEHTATFGGRGALDWRAAAGFLEPPGKRKRDRQADPPTTGERATALARWLNTQSVGNRNAGLFWAANRLLDADPAADLSPLAIAARNIGLRDPEISRTLGSARNTARRGSQAHPQPPDRQAEGER